MRAGSMTQARRGVIALVAATLGGSAALTLAADGWVEAPLETLPRAVPQSEAEKEQGRQHGRTLPTPERLQPTVDAALPDYQPRRDIRIAGRFTGAASDVLPGLVGMWFERFRKVYPGAELSIAPPYAGSLGARELINEKLDFAFVSRELKPDDTSEFVARFGYPPLSLPVSAGSFRHFGFLDAVGVIVHPDNPLRQLTFAQLDRVFSSTQHHGGKPATRWGDLGLGGAWADQPIHVYGVKPWNGFEEFFRQRVLNVGTQRGEWRNGMTLDATVFPIAGRVAADRLGIAYTGLAYLDVPVRLLALRADPEASYTSPSHENVASARYPLTRLIYLNLNRRPGEPLPPVLEELAKFILSRQGQQAVVDQAVFMPLTATQARAGRALLAAPQSPRRVKP